ncbi:ribosomal protein S7 (mitochondrion) [Dictyostelium discoideum]|uniref:Small ribosomal subunit protein uS7m n=1 Tax=Dictyostelium discoideum TaxID=44689 RepID=RT07_DICDI|nr:ribosomal protein S7 [Dictyostelium discoideum]Q23887.1 RecName: Full=Small ribosomal subunit protein uS7m; AltName: Full=Ribosomal protein S7, mitochondrial; Short=MRP-S7; Short=S7mt [Dictyostelium discoideum]BAA04736.1 ribosomal protein S7 [Dictyostelium discoideum]BAA78072.1 ribosomal protein S7 [Dictyostelium discoideum]|eukprot:NP_050090.1 ribosomal protein S7 (mitochondrion) [Dictyostelium discoideum]
MIIKVQKTFEKRLINAFMRKGNYIKAEKIYLKVVNRLSTIGIKNSYQFIRETLLKMTPIMGVVKKKRGVKELIYPKYLEPEMGEKLAIKWLKKTVAKFKGELLIENIVEEFVKASKDQGEVVKEKWALYKEVRYAISCNTRKGHHKSFVEQKLKATQRRKWY